MRSISEIGWDTIIAICTIIVALLSICFTAKQVALQRTHNKKSVKPIGRIRIGDYENNIYVKLENNGVGPLIVKQILTKNKTLQTTKSFIEILPSELQDRVVWTNFTGSYEGRTIMPGQSIELIVWTINDPYKNMQNAKDRIDQDRKDLRKALKDVSVAVTYTDIYEEEEFKYELSNDEFSSWYGRHEKG